MPQVSIELVPRSHESLASDLALIAASRNEFDGYLGHECAAHTTVDRPHLDARSVVEHHHYVWDGLLLPRSRVRILPNSEIVEWLEKGEVSLMVHLWHTSMRTRPAFEPSPL